jgi:hypothetical protein
MACPLVVRDTFIQNQITQAKRHLQNKLDFWIAFDDAPEFPQVAF